MTIGLIWFNNGVMCPESVAGVDPTFTDQNLCHIGLLE
jgi:hypothetical protein